MKLKISLSVSINALDRVVRKIKSYFITGYTGTNYCYGVVANTIRTRRNPTDEIVILGLNPNHATHCILLDKDGEVVADTYYGQFNSGKYTTPRFPNYGAKVLLRSTVKEFFKDILV